VYSVHITDLIHEVSRTVVVLSTGTAETIVAKTCVLVLGLSDRSHWLVLALCMALH